MEPCGAEELMPRLLPVEAEAGGAEEDPDPDAPPRTPQEYLRRVQLEAARCPEVVVAPLDPRRVRRARPVSVQLPGCRPAPEGFSPPLSSQRQQAALFSAVRQSLDRHRQRWRAQRLDGNVALPPAEDEEGWRRFCLGRRWLSEEAPPGGGQEGIDYAQIGFPPLLTIVSRMNQVTVTSVLEYLTNWLGEKEFTPELGRWLYALLACLEKPLLPEAHSLIRQLARQCSEVRAMENKNDDERVSALNLLICLVGRYFDQHDLADEPS